MHAPRLVLAAITMATTACMTVTREPVAFAASSYHAFDSEDYVFKRWVTGESCEKYSAYQVFGSLGYVRVDQTDRPRSIELALKQALNVVEGTVFLANVSIETEERAAFLKPLEVCTVVTGAAMGPKSKKTSTPTATPKATPKPAQPDDDAEDDDGDPVRR
jgi:hypothetical protein